MNLLRHYRWPIMKQIITVYVKECLQCQKPKSKTGFPFGVYSSLDDLIAGGISMLILFPISKPMSSPVTMKLWGYSTVNQNDSFCDY